MNNLSSKLLFAAALSLATPACKESSNDITEPIKDTVRVQQEEVLNQPEASVKPPSPIEEKKPDPVVQRAKELLPNASAYEAGFAKASQIYKDALKRGNNDLVRFVEEKRAAFKAQLKKSAAETGAGLEFKRSQLLYEFIEDIPPQTFRYALNGHGAVVSFGLINEFEKEKWTDFLFKSIAYNFGNGPDKIIEDAPEGESDAIPQLGVEITVSGKNTFRFIVISENGNSAGLDQLTIKFSPGDGSFETMEELFSSWSSGHGLADAEEDRIPHHEKDYFNYYDPSLSRSEDGPGENGPDIVIPERLNDIWPTGYPN